MNVTLIKFAPVFGIVMLSLFAPQVSVASEDDGIYESLADVNIGKVFFSPDKRQAIDRNRGNTSAAGNPEPLTIDKAARIFTAACTGRIEDLRDT